jgi:site-specific DNA-methyltransferase (adenine-specific)
MEQQGYVVPALANPGNVFSIPVGGGVMGDKLCHQNEAPFPERLAEIFVRSCCPPGGWVLDPFLGSGTTAAVCIDAGRNCVGIDVRESQIELSKQRIANRTVGMLA